MAGGSGVAVAVGVGRAAARVGGALPPARPCKTPATLSHAFSRVRILWVETWDAISKGMAPEVGVAAYVPLAQLCVLAFLLRQAGVLFRLEGGRTGGSARTQSGVLGLELRDAHLELDELVFFLVAGRLGCVGSRWLWVSVRAGWEEGWRVMRTCDAISVCPGFPPLVGGLVRVAWSFVGVGIGGGRGRGGDGGGGRGGVECGGMDVGLHECGGEG